MEQVLYIFFGWLLGVLSSLSTRRSDRNQRINDFITGLYAQMLEIHPRLVVSYLSTKDHLEPLRQETLEWIDSMLPSHHNFTIEEKFKAVNRSLISRAKEQRDAFEAANKILFESITSVPRGKGLKKFGLTFLENNLGAISLLDNDLQILIWKILDRINLINQEVDRYLFYFQKTFDPQVMAVNEAALDTNMSASLQMISGEIHRTAKVVLELLDNLKTQKDRWSYKSSLARFKLMMRRTN
jgi:hypothetical protein